MHTTEHTTRTSFAGAGVFALLRGRLRVRGTGAPSAALLALFVSIAVVLLAPSVANAAFTRPYLRQLTGTCEKAGESPPACIGSKFIPFSTLGGVAVDKEVAGQENDVWVGSGGQLDEFGPAYEANSFLELVEPGGESDSLASERVSGKLYREGVLNKNVAVDNSPEGDIADESHCVLTECVHYVSTAGESQNGGGIEKLNAKEEPAPFTGSASYIEGAHHNTITGPPAPVASECAFNGAGGVPGAVAVDAEGNIYVAMSTCAQVLEYFASGEFRHAFELASPEVPRVGAQGYVGRPAGVAIDPVSGHLVVSVRAPDGGAIDEFDLQTGKFVAEIADNGEGRELQKPAAVAVDSLGDVYVVEQEGNTVEVWGPGAYFPTVTLGVASGRTSEGAVLNGVVDPAQNGNPTPAPVTECYFQYIEEAVYQRALAKEKQEREKREPLTGEEGFPKAEAGKATCEPPEIVGGLEESHPVEATIEDLESGKTYRYRLIATTELGKNGGTRQSESLAFTALALPRIVSSSAANVSSTFADLQAQIDPLGASTSYRFEYDTRPYVEGEGAHGTSIPVPDEGIGAGGPTGGSDESVLQHAGPLSPGTTYYYRVVASNAQGVATGAVCAGKPGPDCTFATQPAAQAGAPDGRGYELVTPAAKQGGSDMFAEPETNHVFENRFNVGTPAETGEGFFLKTDSAFGEYPFALDQQYVFSRDLDEGDWSFASLAVPSLGTQLAVSSTLFDPTDLSRVALNDDVGSLVGEEGERLTNLVGPPGASTLCQGAVSLEAAVAEDCYIKVHEDTPTLNTKEIEAGAQFVGGSRDLGHVVLEGALPGLCPGSEQVEHGHVLCEWAGGYETTESGEVKPELKLVDVNDEEEPVSECGASLGAIGSPEAAIAGAAHGAVSSDGSHVFFTAPDPQAEGKGCWDRALANTPQLYARIGGASTLEVSKPEAGVSEEGHPPVLYPAKYLGASEEGTRVFFATETWVTKNHPKGHDLELYECEITETEGVAACVLTRVSAGPDSEAGAGLHMFFAVSANGTVVYFSANGVLAPGAGTEGDCEQGSGSGGDSIEGGCGLYRYQAATGGGAARVSFIATVASSVYGNGTAGDPLTIQPLFTRAYASPDGRFLLFNNSGGIYRYDAASESLVLVAPSGQFTRSASLEAASGPVHAMSADGSYVFFDTTEALVPQATNHTLDTYEWHEDLLTHERTLSLIGSGSDPAPTYFLGYSPTYNTKGERLEAGSVFIGTHAKLVPQDTNSVGNIYSARVCGVESSCIQPPAGETAQCEGGSCQTPPAAPPDPVATLLAPPAPATLAPPPAKKVTTKTVKCKKGETKNNKGKCVPKKKTKKRAKKASHNGRTGR